MSRAKSAGRRSTAVDPRFGSAAIAKLINRSMRDGKKSVAQKQVYNALEILENTLRRNPVEILDEAIERVKPQMEVRSRRVGGASYQVPMPVRPDRAFSLAIRWMVNESNKRSNSAYHSYADKLSAEILDILKEEGGAYGKKITTHKMAEANKAFSHFRW